MKKIFFIAVLVAGVSCANAQKVDEANVPAAVMTTFKSKCPKVASAKWEKEDGNFEAHYKSGNSEMTCVIDPSGKYVQSEVAIDAASLPKPATEYLSKNMPGKKITEVAKITSADGKVTYEAEVDNVDYTFDSTGNLIKKEADND